MSKTPAKQPNLGPFWRLFLRRQKGAKMGCFGGFFGHFGGKTCDFGLKISTQHSPTPPRCTPGRDWSSNDVFDSLRFSISQFCLTHEAFGPPPDLGNAPMPRGQKKSNRHRNTSCVVFSPQSVSQQSVWALKVRFGKIDVPVRLTCVSFRGAPKTGSSSPTTKIGPRASEQL